MTDRPPWVVEAERECPWLVGQRLKDAIVAAARPCAEVMCDEADLDRLRRAIREYDEWRDAKRKENQP